MEFGIGRPAGARWKREKEDTELACLEGGSKEGV